MISRLWLILVLLLPQVGMSAIVCPGGDSDGMAVAASSDGSCEPRSCCCCPPDACPCLHDTPDAPPTPKAPAPTEDGPRTLCVAGPTVTHCFAATEFIIDLSVARRHDLQRLSLASWQAFAGIWLT